MMRRLASTLCDIAGHVLPVAHKRWADAMAAELPHTENDRAALAYAAGCLVAAMRERAHEFDTRFAAGLWSVAVTTSLFGIIQLACAVRGIEVLFGARDGMREALVHDGANLALVARYDAARPIVIGIFILLGCVHLASAWFLSRMQLRKFFITWCTALLIASVAVMIQLSIVRNTGGIPSEFHGLLVPAVVLAALLAWSRGRHKGRMS